MKKIGSLIGLVLLVAACSSPKYAYHFDHYDYNSGKKKSLQDEVTATKSPLLLNQEAFVASASESPVILAEEQSIIAPSADQTKNDFAKKYNAMSKTERKAFKAELKKELKAYAQAKKSGQSVTSTGAINQLDHDLKMAILFGAVGLTLSLFGGVNSVFWILGVIAIVVGVVFLVSWLMRQ